MKKLHVAAFALACGITWGLFLFFLSCASAMWGIGGSFVSLLSDMYIGYKATFAGGLIGFVWAFVDGFIGALIFVLLYNYFAKKLK